MEFMQNPAMGPQRVVVKLARKSDDDASSAADEQPPLKKCKTRRASREIVLSSKDDKKPPPSWTALPPELRLLILKQIYKDSARHKRRALLATVSLEWRDFFERRNYRILRLWSDDLKDDIPKLRLGGAVSARHVPLIRKIHLEVELASFTCRNCMDTGSDNWIRKCGSLFRETVSQLFTVLSTWDLPRDGGGITLTLTANTPSDAAHSFRNYDFGHGIPAEKQGDAYRRAIGLAWNDTHRDRLHGWTWEDGFLRQAEHPTMACILRQFSPLCKSPLPTTAAVPKNPRPSKSVKSKAETEPPTTSEPKGREGEEKENKGISYCPKVPIITELIIPRQTRRNLSVPAIASLWECLPNLTSMTYQPWRIGRFVSRVFDPEMAKLIRTSLPGSIKSLSVFEDFNEKLTYSLVTPGLAIPLQAGGRSILRPPLNNISSDEWAFIKNVEDESVESPRLGENALPEVEDGMSDMDTDTDSDSDYETDHDSESAGPSPPQNPSLLASAFVHVSQQLVFLSVGYMIDARHFFARICQQCYRLPLRSSHDPGDKKGAAEAATVQTDHAGDANSVSGDKMEGEEAGALVLRRRVIRRRSFISERWEHEPDQAKEEKTRTRKKNPTENKNKKNFWPELEELILTSPIMSVEAKRTEILTLLKQASLAARRMPRLKKLVIWHCGKYEEEEAGKGMPACAFTYEVTEPGKVANLHWRGTWSLGLSPDEEEELMGAWKRAAQAYVGEPARRDPHNCDKSGRGDSFQRDRAGAYLRLFQEWPAIAPGMIESHGDAIHYLELPLEILGRRSIDQIRREGKLARLA